MDSDVLHRLEEKIREAVHEMDRLRKENRQLKGKGGGAKGTASVASERLEKEVSILQRERAAVRTRIEGLIESMETAS